MTFEEWNRQTAVILGGAFLFTKYACQAMIGEERRQRHQHRLDRRAIRASPATSPIRPPSAAC